MIFMQGEHSWWTSAIKEMRGLMTLISSSRLNTPKDSERTECRIYQMIGRKQVIALFNNSLKSDPGIDQHA